MKKQNKKVLLLSLVMAAVMVLPMTMSAQGSRSLFGKNEPGNRGTATQYNDNQMSLEDPIHRDPTAPLGSGLFIMLAAGAGYAIIKKKED